jgi:hypothetical protein
MSYRRACLTGVYLAGVWLIGVHLKSLATRAVTVLGGMRWCVMVPPNGSGAVTGAVCGGHGECTLITSSDC